MCFYTTYSYLSSIIIEFFFTDGGWGNWHLHKSCSHSCGWGKEIHRRYCDNPSPANGGRSCTGNKKKENDCKIVDCPIGMKNYEAL